MAHLNNEAQRNNKSANASIHADKTVCPRCGRKNALLPFSNGHLTSIYTSGVKCRWCDFVRSRTIDFSQVPPVEIARVGY